MMSLGERMYDRWRFRIIVLLMGLLGALAISAVLRQHFPLSLGAELGLMPCLLREQDIKKCLPPRKLGPFEWSCVVGGVLWVFVSPLLG
jgi:hypothetical protein